MIYYYFDVVFEVGVDVVYFVDECYVWNLVFVCLVLDCFGLWFDVSDGVEVGDGIVEYV